jgi:hypothetical protein
MIPSYDDGDAQYVNALHENMRNSPDQINVEEWSQAVTVNTNVVYPFLFIYDALGKNDVYVRSHIRCDPKLWEDCKLSSSYVRDIKSREGTTFVIVQVIIRLHTVTVFLHRQNANDAYGWRAVLCDPNWIFPYLDSSEISSDTRRIALGRHVLEKFVLPEEKNPVNYIVELHRCINVNVCVPPLIARNGICFTGLCATLMATKIQVLKNKTLKASNGDGLMNTIIEASHNFRPETEKLIHGYYFRESIPYFRELLQKQKENEGNSSGGGEGKIERSKSPSSIPRTLRRLIIKPLLQEKHKTNGPVSLPMPDGIPRSRDSSSRYSLVRSKRK